MTHRPIDLANPITFPDAERRSKTITTAEADRRQRAALMARRLPAVPAGALPGLSAVPRILSEGERAAAHALPPSRATQRAAEQQSRQEKLPAPVRDAKFPLTLIGREALAAVYRANRAAGDQPAPMPRAELAKVIGVTPTDAERLLTELVNAGAVERYPGFGPGTAARYRAAL